MIGFHYPRMWVIFMAIILGFYPRLVLCAKNGALGIHSSTKSNLSVTIPPLAHITNVGQLQFHKSSSSNASLRASVDACVYSNLSDAGYKVTAMKFASGITLVIHPKTCQNSSFCKNCQHSSKTIEVTADKKTVEALSHSTYADSLALMIEPN